MRIATRSRWWRTWLVAAVGAALTLAVAAPAHGGSTLEVVGSGDAQANVVRVGPTTGGLQVAVTFGQSLADFQGSLGRAQSRVLDPGVLGLVLTAESCKGDPPALDPSFLPPTVRAENRGGTETKRATYLAPPASGGAPLAGIGDQQVEAGEGPTGTATTTLAAMEIPGLLRTGGGKAVAHSAVVDGTTRLARAVSVTGELDLGGGAVRMEGLRWEIEQRSGPDYPDDIEVASKFSIGRLVIAGQELPAPDTPEELVEAFAQVNAALAPIGLSAEPPRFERDEDIVRLHPLALRIDQSQLGGQTVGPALEALNGVRQPAVDALLSADCQFGGLVLVGDVILGIGAGSGGLLLEVGGVQAMTEGRTFADPFGAAAAPFAAPVAPGMPARASTAPPAGAATTAAEAPDGPAGVGPSPAGGAEPPVELATPSDFGPSTNASASSESSPALLVGIMALAGVVAMAAADYARMRRAQFTPGGGGR